jgi:hypothetical protein
MAAMRIGSVMRQPKVAEGAALFRPTISFCCFNETKKIPSLRVRVEDAQAKQSSTGLVSF